MNLISTGGICLSLLVNVIPGEHPMFPGSHWQCGCEDGADTDCTFKLYLGAYEISKFLSDEQPKFETAIFPRSRAIFLVEQPKMSGCISRDMPMRVSTTCNYTNCSSSRYLGPERSFGPGRSTPGGLTFQLI